MGLDVSHDCWGGAYSRFNRFRCALADAAGWEIGKTDGLDDWFIPGDEPLPESAIAGAWPDGAPDDPLKVLLWHSDCDGVIMRRHLIPLAERLEGLAEKLPNIRGEDFTEAALQFAKGLREAAEAGEQVRFF